MELSRFFQRLTERQWRNLINTPLQWGVFRVRNIFNRFNGFHRARKTVERVYARTAPIYTSLKRGVNENPCLAISSRGLHASSHGS